MSLGAEYDVIGLLKNVDPAYLFSVEQMKLYTKSIIKYSFLSSNQSIYSPGIMNRMDATISVAFLGRHKFSIVISTEGNNRSNNYDFKFDSK